MKNIDREELHCLCDTALEQRLDPVQFERLEKMIVDDPDARNYYLEHVALHLDLFEHCSGPKSDMMMPFADCFKVAAKKEGVRFFRRHVIAAVLAISSAAIIAWVFASPFLSSWFQYDEKTGINVVQNNDNSNIPQTVSSHESSGESAVESTFAMVFEMQECRWGSIDSDAEFGIGHEKRIGHRKIRLEQGLAQLRFDNGVVMTMEGPVSLSVQSMDRCFLHSGKVFAKVSPEGKGFTVDTPGAAVEDLGTEFGVLVQNGKEAEVQVYSGRVDIHHSKDGAVPVLSGGRLRFSNYDDELTDPDAELKKRKPESDENVVVCTTADGQGKEAVVLSGGNYDDLGSRVSGKSDIYMLIKNSGGADNPWNRKGYFSIDLSDVPTKTFGNAELELTFGPSGVGFGIFSPETAVFSVYGIVDQEQDFWDPETITWGNAPANLPGGNTIDLTRVVLIGRFEIKREESSGVRILSGMALKQFLELDTNDLVTFVLVCETREPKGMGFAYGFAGYRHPDLPPPTLRLYLRND